MFLPSVKEMIATVQIYIHHRKNVEANIAINGARDYALLTKAYNIANNWLTENGFKQIIVN